MNPPEYKFCPVCSGRFETRVIKDGEPERLICGECGFVFYLGPKLVASALFELDGGILLVQRAIEPGYGKCTFPGGFVERGERAETAAEREVLEECGLEIEVTGVLGGRTAPLPSRCRSRSRVCGLPAIAVFKAEVTGGEPEPLDETMDVQSFPRDALPWPDMAFPSTEHALKDYLRERRPRTGR